MDTREGQERKSLEDDLARSKRAIEFLFKLLMGRLDLITHQVEMLEKDRASNARRINAKFESVEASLERKIVKLEIDQLTSNSHLINDSVFAEVKEIIAGLPETIVAQVQNDGEGGAPRATPSSRGKEVSEDAGKSNPG